MRSEFEVFLRLLRAFVFSSTCQIYPSQPRSPIPSWCKARLWDYSLSYSSLCIIPGSQWGRYSIYPDIWCLLRCQLLLFLGEELHIFVAEFLVKKSEKTEEPLFLMDHSCHDDFFDIFWHLKLYIFLFSSWGWCRLRWIKSLDWFGASLWYPLLEKC